MHIYQKIRLHKYPNRIVLVLPHLSDMYPDKSTLFSTEHAHYQETWACNKYVAFVLVKLKFQHVSLGSLKNKISVGCHIVMFPARRTWCDIAT